MNGLHLFVAGGSLK